MRISHDHSLDKEAYGRKDGPLTIVYTAIANVWDDLDGAWQRACLLFFLWSQKSSRFRFSCARPVICLSVTAHTQNPKICVVFPDLRLTEN